MWHITQTYKCDIIYGCVVNSHITFLAIVTVFWRTTVTIVLMLMNWQHMPKAVPSFLPNTFSTFLMLHLICVCVYTQQLKKKRVQIYTWRLQVAPHLPLQLHFNSTSVQAATVSLQKVPSFQIFSGIPAGPILCNFTLTWLDNLHHFSNLPNNFQFNATWHRQYTIFISLTWCGIDDLWPHLSCVGD